MTYKFSILFVIASLFTLSLFAQTIEFVENRGQWDSRVKYMGRVDAGAFFIEESGFTVVQHSPEDWGKMTEAVHGHGTDASSRIPQGLTLR
ncbi:MAG TPA: hypothetical protein VGE06_00870, partial [Flavisolibacter sp.]